MDVFWMLRKHMQMQQAVWIKFTQNPILKSKLIQTNDALLVHVRFFMSMLYARIDFFLIQDDRQDDFWGCGPHGTGENQLGKILMMLRAKFKGLPNKFPNLTGWKEAIKFNNLQWKSNTAASFAPPPFPVYKIMKLNAVPFPSVNFGPTIPEIPPRLVSRPRTQPLTWVPPRRNITRKSSKPDAYPIPDLLSWMERADLMDKNEAHHPYPPDRNWKGADFLKHHAVTFFYDEADRATYWLTNFVMVSFEVEEDGKRTVFPSSEHYFQWAKV
jgi:predicted NAD-dependent protein-ADP-ribosyltransferase YbiA (DUF1768 family)